MATPGMTNDDISLAQWALVDEIRDRIKWTGSHFTGKGTPQKVSGDLTLAHS